jgi:hypothetical protein
MPHQPAPPPPRPDTEPGPKPTPPPAQPPESDPSTFPGLIYRICTHWRALLGALVALVVLVAVVVLAVRLLGLHATIGPIEFEPAPQQQEAADVAVQPRYAV